jgi:hypothetical protein
MVMAEPAEDYRYDDGILLFFILADLKNLGKDNASS